MTEFVLPELPEKEAFTPMKGGRYRFGVGQVYAYSERQMTQYATDAIKSALSASPPPPEAQGESVSVLLERAAQIAEAYREETDGQSMYIADKIRALIPSIEQREG
jgi:hypothetical protein